MKGGQTKQNFPKYDGRTRQLVSPANILKEKQSFMPLGVFVPFHRGRPPCKCRRLPAADISIGLLHVITAGFGIENSVPAVPGRVQAAVNGVSGTVGGAKLAGAAQGGKGELIGGRGRAAAYR